MSIKGRYVGSVRVGQKLTYLDMDDAQKQQNNKVLAKQQLPMDANYSGIIDAMFLIFHWEAIMLLHFISPLDSRGSIYFARNANLIIGGARRSQYRVYQQVL